MDCVFDDSFDAAFDICDVPVAEGGHRVGLIRLPEEDPDELLALI